MKFDWYQASVPDVDPAVVMATLSNSDYYGQWEENRPAKGYDVGLQFVVAGDVLYRINHGGQNAQYGANVSASGRSADKLATVIREHFPRHRVSRLDSCVDYHHKDVYDYLRSRALVIAKEQKVQVREIVKPLAESDDGRTLYLGAPSSAVSMRIYEKGKQLGQGDEWVRAELQVRPQKSTKDTVASLSAVELWGIAKWSHAFAIQMGHDNLTRVDPHIYQPSDHDRAKRFMLKQYRKVFEQMFLTHGSWDTVGVQIGYDLEHANDDHEKIVLTPISKPLDDDWKALMEKFNKS